MLQCHTSYCYLLEIASVLPVLYYWPSEHVEIHYFHADFLYLVWPFVILACANGHVG
uniref:Uncharacterized protein n=1 Tax=Rhizophora mucronata TaxID=61149 RepID=A0A2P2P885_RHIMU